MTRLLAAIRKEFLQFARDRMLIALILWTYTIEVVLCAYALTFDVTHLRLAVYDQSGTQLSHELIENFTSTPYFGRASFVYSPGEIDRALDASQVDLGINIPPDFAERIGEQRSVDVQIILSGTNSNTASIARGYATTILQKFSQDMMKVSLAQHGERVALPEIEPLVRIWYNPELRFRYFIVISMIVVAGFMVGMIHVSATIVREKESGTIEQLLLTPLRKPELILSKVAPTFAIGLLSLFPSLLIALWFHVPIRGSVPLFFFASAVALFSSMGIGVYISLRARNLQQALLISFFILFPVMFLSGTLVPIESMPRALRFLSYLSPLRYYMEISLGIFLKGVGLKILWPEFVSLFVFGAVVFPLSLRRLKRSI